MSDASRNRQQLERLSYHRVTTRIVPLLDAMKTQKMKMKMKMPCGAHVGGKPNLYKTLNEKHQMGRSTLSGCLAIRLE